MDKLQVIFHIPENCWKVGLIVDEFKHFDHNPGQARIRESIEKYNRGRRRRPCTASFEAAQYCVRPLILFNQIKLKGHKDLF